jgi:hypothetical protein
VLSTKLSKSYLQAKRKCFRVFHKHVYNRRDDVWRDYVNRLGVQLHDHFDDAGRRNFSLINAFEIIQEISHFSN